MNLTKPVKFGIAIVVGLVLLGLFPFNCGKNESRLNTVGVKVSAFGGVQDTTLQTGYHLLVPFIDKVYTLPTSVQTKTMRKLQPRPKMVSGSTLILT